MDRFKFIGKIRAIKDGEVATKQYDSGWEIARYSFLCLSGDNSQFLSLSAGKWSDASGKDTTIYTLAKSEKGQKCEKLNVSWKDRKKAEIVEQVAAFKKFTIDLDVDGKDENGDPGKNRRDYIHPYDFLMTIANIISGENYKDAIFEITGNIERSYNPEKNDYFSSYVPTKIRRVSDNAVQSCTGTIELYFTDDTPNGITFDTSCQAETGMINVNGFSKFYDEMAKKNGYAPVTVQVPCKADETKKIEFFKKIFSLSKRTEVKRMGLDVEFLRGSQQKEITYDDLSEDQKDMINYGFATLESIKREMNGGGKAYGERVTSTIFKGPAYGYSNGSVIDETVTSDDLMTPPIPEERPAKTAKKPVASDDDDDLFGL